MEKILSDGFCEMSQEEMLVTDGGALLETLAVLGSAWVIYELSYAVGKAIKHATK